MHTQRFNYFSLILLTAWIAMTTPLLAVPGSVTYQGFVDVNGAAFDGSGTFRFALIDSGATVSYWSNDGTSAVGSEPTAGVPLTVFEGLFTVALGDSSLTNMTAIPATVFDNDDVLLRIWFDDGSNGSQLLSPDQSLATVPYAVRATSADVESQNLSDVLAVGNSAGNTKITGLADPTAAQDAATMAWVAANNDDADASITNEIQNLSSVLGVGNSAGTTRITNLGAPTADADAATKKYVDDNAGGGSMLQVTKANVAQNTVSTVTGTGVVAVYELIPSQIATAGSCIGRYPIIYPVAQVFDATTAKATQEFPGNEAWFGVDPSLTREGTENLQTSFGTDDLTANVKLNFDLGSARTPTGIWLENFPPTSANSGVGIFRVYGSNNAAAFANTTYATTTNLTQLGGTFTAVIDTDANAEEPQCFNFTNTTSYRYIILRLETNLGGNWIGFRHAQMTSTSPSPTRYVLMRPGIDYAVSRSTATGSQTLSIKRLKSGTSTLVIDYF